MKARKAAAAGAHGSCIGEANAAAKLVELAKAHPIAAGCGAQPHERSDKENTPRAEPSAAMAMARADNEI
jgi:hypothetical protein